MPRGDALVGLKRVGNYTPQYIYDAFNEPIGALPLQIGVGVSIVISFTFSQKKKITPAILPFMCFCELSFQMSHRRLLTLRQLSVFR